MFKIKPRIYVENGKMDAGKKYRGKIEKVILQYVHEMEQDLKTAKRDRVFITQTGCSTEVVKSVKDYLKNLNYFKEIIITNAGGVISSHCGPGTLGVLFIAGGTKFGPYDKQFDTNMTRELRRLHTFVIWLSRRILKTVRKMIVTMNMKDNMTIKNIFLIQSLTVCLIFF